MMAPVDFSGAVFTCAHFFKKQPKYPAYAIVTTLLHKSRHSFTHAFLVTNDLKCCGFGSSECLSDLKNCTSQGPGVHFFCHFFTNPQKMQLSLTYHRVNLLKKAEELCFRQRVLLWLSRLRLHYLAELFSRVEVGTLLLLKFVVTFCHSKNFKVHTN